MSADGPVTEALDQLRDALVVLVIGGASTAGRGRQRVDVQAESKLRADERRNRRDELQAVMVLFGAVFGWVIFVVAAMVAVAILIFG